MFKPLIVSLAVSASFSVLADNCGTYGCPTGASGNQQIQRPIYTLSNNAQTKFADWVAYQVTPSTMSGPKRSRYWKSDPDISSQHTLEKDDYKSAWATIHTDRGHQVPLASFSNTPYWAQTNYLSNITPQSSNLNQGPWVRLETQVRELVKTGTSAYVITGPLYEWYFATLPEADESHTIPSGYFKIVATISSSGWINASGFVMEQNAGRRDNFCQTEVTIDEIERRSGFNFFPSMPGYKESAVEARLGGLKTALGC